MALVKALMRFFGYLYHGVLALFLLALSAMALSTGMHTLQMKMLPWDGSALTYWLLAAGIIGLAVVLLAVRGVLPALLFIWSLVVLGFMLKGYIFSGYYFDTGEFSKTVYLILGALIATIGAWFGISRTPRRLKKL